MNIELKRSDKKTISGKALYFLTSRMKLGGFTAEQVVKGLEVMGYSLTNQKDAISDVFALLTNKEVAIKTFGLCPTNEQLKAMGVTLQSVVVFGKVPAKAA